MMIPFFRHHTGARTAWKGQDIVVYVGGVETDRISAAEIERVVLVHRSDGNTPGDLEVALIQLSNELVALSADTGIAGRILFERQAFWNERACIYWVSSRSVALPRALRRCRGGLLSSGVPIARVAAAEATAARQLAAGWPADLGRTQADAHRTRPAVLARQHGRGHEHGARRSLSGHSKRDSRSHFVATHFSPSITGAPPCSVRVLGCGRS